MLGAGGNDLIGTDLQKPRGATNDTFLFPCSSLVAYGLYKPQGVAF